MGGENGLKTGVREFDASKVDVMSMHEQVALSASSFESKYHEM